MAVKTLTSVVAVPLALSVLTACASAAAVSNYAVREIVPLPGYEYVAPIAVNDRGQVLGNCIHVVGPYSSDTVSTPVLWNPDGSVTRIDPWAGAYPYTWADGLNNQGQVVGRGQSDQLWAYANGSVRILPGARMNSPVVLNDAGIVAGTDFASPIAIWNTTSLSVTRPALPDDWYSPAVLGINGLSQVVGTAWHGADYVGFILDPDGRVRVLETAGISMEPRAINDLGTVVGVTWVQSPAGGSITYPAAWDDAGLRLLPSFSTWAWDNVVRAINDAGLMVGTSDDRAALWTPSAIYDLNTLIPAGTGVRLDTAVSINGAGVILAHDGSYDGFAGRAYLLTPTPEPSVAAGVVFMSLGLLPRRRRHRAC